jgi:uncharacterized protein (TIRG00374 family)
MDHAYIDTLLRRVVVVVVIAALLYLAVAVATGIHELIEAIQRIGYTAIIMGLLASLMNFALRFARWLWIFSALEMPYVPALAQMRVYLAGLALTATPGKLGETVRSALLLRHDVPVGASLAAFLADRLADLLGVLLLCAITAGSPAVLWSFTIATSAVLVASIALSRASHNKRLEMQLLSILRSCRLVHIAQWTSDALPSFSVLWTWKRIPMLVLAGFTAYGLQGLVFLYFSQILWPDLGNIVALRLFSTSTLTGAASMLPGGLGAIEASLFAGLALAGVPAILAVSTVLAFRTVTLWFGILRGVIAMLLTPQHSST